MSPESMKRRTFDEIKHPQKTTKNDIIHQNYMNRDIKKMNKSDREKNDSKQSANRWHMPQGEKSS